MKTSKWMFIFVLACLAVSQGSIVSGDSEGTFSLGERLVRHLWADIKAGNVEALENVTAAGFQSIHEDGSRNRKEELQLIKGVNLGEYTLSSFKVTQNGPVIVVTYFVSVEETIGDKRLPGTKPAARLSAWLKTDDGWKWIIHANLRSLK